MFSTSNLKKYVNKLSNWHKEGEQTKCIAQAYYKSKCIDS